LLLIRSILLAVLLTRAIDLFYFMASAKLTPEEKDYQQLMLNKLSERIKQFRLEKGEDNYEKFAFKHNINRSQYWRYENGEDMRFSSLLKILAALEVSLKDFFSDGFD
jgi:hypothetical protein